MRKSFVQNNSCQNECRAPVRRIVFQTEIDSRIETVFVVQAGKEDLQVPGENDEISVQLSHGTLSGFVRWVQIVDLNASESATPASEAIVFISSYATSE